MRIAGLQKVSTIDYPGEICCVIFLFGCNFRCGFCHNPGLVIGNSNEDVECFNEEEVLDFLSNRMGKLDAVCISGGEPLMSLDFDFVRRVKSMGFKVKIDTNGSFPERLRELIDLGLIDYIAMDVKGAREDYLNIVNVDIDLNKIEESIKIVNDFKRRENGHGLHGPFRFESEFRTTIVPGLHEGKSLVEMGKWMNKVCKGKVEKIFLQGFRAGEKMIDSSFIGKDDVLEGELLRLKGEIECLFDEVVVRV